MIVTKSYTAAIFLLSSLLIQIFGCTSPIDQSEISITPVKPGTSAISTGSYSTATIANQTEFPNNTAGIEPSATSTNTPAVTISESAAPVLTLTSLPTLSPEQAKDTILELIANNAGCDLPCWWGITPGETTWEETLLRLSPLGKVASTNLNNGVVFYEFEFIVPKTIDSLGYVWPNVFVKNGIVTSVGTNSNWVRQGTDYSLAGILKTLGKPDEIWLKLYPVSMTEPHYDIRLFYSTKGIEIDANGNAQVQGDKFTICPREFKLGEFPPGMLLWKPEENITFNNIGVNLLGDPITRDTSGFHMLNELSTNFDVESFYDTFLDPDTNACFDLNIKNPE